PGISDRGDNLINLAAFARTAVVVVGGSTGAGLHAAGGITGGAVKSHGPVQIGSGMPDDDVPSVGGTGKRRVREGDEWRNGGEAPDRAVGRALSVLLVDSPVVKRIATQCAWRITGPGLILDERRRIAGAEADIM